MLKNIITVFSVFLIIFIVGAIFSYFGLENIYFLLLGMIDILLFIGAIKNFTWGRARVRGLEKLWYILFFSVIILSFLFSLFQIYEIMFLKLEWYISIAIPILPIMIGILMYFAYKTFANDEIKAGVYAYLIVFIMGSTSGIKTEKILINNTSYLFEHSILKNSVSKFFNDAPIVKNFTNYFKSFNKIENQIFHAEETVVGKVFWKSSQEKGRVGEYVTNVLALRGWKKITSKVDKIHGIDHLLVKYNNDGSIKKIQILETKVNNSKLNKNQMSDQWIIDNCKKILKKGDNEQKKVANFVITNIGNNDNKVIKKLYHHNFKTGETTISDLGKNGNIVKINSQFKSNTLINVLNKYHKSSSQTN